VGYKQFGTETHIDFYFIPARVKPFFGDLVIRKDHCTRRFGFIVLCLLASVVISQGITFLR
jgi:hypothetical protein